MPGTPNTPSLKGYGVYGKNGRPTLREYPVDATSAAIRKGDPVKQVAGGIIRKAAPADTAILGFAEEPSDPASGLAREIPAPPAMTDDAGRTLIRVAVADTNNVFQARTKVAPSQANVTKTFDLVADAGDANGFVIDNQAAPVTNIVQVIGVVNEVNAANTRSRVDFQVPPGKSQFLGVAGA